MSASGPSGPLVFTIFLKNSFRNQTDWTQVRPDVMFGLAGWHRGYKTFFMLNSTEHELLIKAKIQANEEVSCFKSLRCCIYHAYRCLNANKCWHFNIYKQDKFHAQLS